MKIFNIYLALLFSCWVFSQSPKSYAQQLISKLSSAEFAGRGYVLNGMDKAVGEIEEQYKKIGILPFKQGYFQSFTYPVNIIESSFLKINGKELKIGQDYLPGSGSPSLKGIFYPLVFNSAAVDSLYENTDRKFFYEELDRLNGKPIVFPLTQFRENLNIEGTSANKFYHEIPQLIVQGNFSLSSPLLIEQVDSKFIHTISPMQSQTVDIFVNAGSVAKKIETVELDIKTHFDSAFHAKNLVGYIPGKRSDSLIVLTAHYDHLGQINDLIFPGANDNASGVSLLLSMAKVYAKTKPKFDMVFIAFAGEEAGLKGSEYFVEHPLFDLKRIKFLLNFDMVGTGEEGIEVVNGNVFKKQFKKLEQISYDYHYLREVKSRGQACISDHCPFYFKAVPSFYVYTLGGKRGYHDKTDSEVSLYAFDNLVALFTKFINQL